MVFSKYFSVLTVLYCVVQLGGVVAEPSRRTPVLTHPNRGHPRQLGEGKGATIQQQGA